MTISIEQFKRVMGQRASTVNVVTTHVDQIVHGMTATSFCSVSLDPPLVLVCIAKRQRSHELVAQAGAFVVNILSKDQSQLAERFAGMLDCGPDRFDDLSYRTAITGSPILLDAVAWLDCRVWNAYDGGDHTIFVGQVVDGDAPNNNLPLLYYQRRWVSLQNVG